MNPFQPSRGSKNRLAKLTDEKVREIRSSDETVEQLAKRYGVAESTIDKVLRRYTWQHVD